jgi:hypothetical protein
MEVTHSKFIVVCIEATWVEEECCDRFPRVIHVPDNPTL